MEEIIFKLEADIANLRYDLKQDWATDKEARMINLHLLITAKANLESLLEINDH